MTNEGLAAFIDWEGGVEAAVQHGLRDPVDDPKAQKLWDAVVKAHGPFDKAAQKLTAYLESASEETST